MRNLELFFLAIMASPLLCVGQSMPTECEGLKNYQDTSFNEISPSYNLISDNGSHNKEVGPQLWGYSLNSKLFLEVTPPLELMGEIKYKVKGISLYKSNRKTEDILIYKDEAFESNESNYIRCEIRTLGSDRKSIGGNYRVVFSSIVQIDCNGNQIELVDADYFWFVNPASFEFWVSYQIDSIINGRRMPHLILLINGVEQPDNPIVTNEDTVLISLGFPNGAKIDPEILLDFTFSELEINEWGCAQRKSYRTGEYLKAPLEIIARELEIEYYGRFTVQIEALYYKTSLGEKYEIEIPNLHDRIAGFYKNSE